MRWSFVSTVAFATFWSANARSISRNARCGDDYNGATCRNSEWGSCCSQYGWCGSTKDYCGVGCQSKFGTCDSLAVSSARSSTVRISTSSRSSTPSHVSSTSTRASPSPAPQPISKNARCGADFGGQTCKGSKWGDCCSQYFYCGSTDDYCAPKSCQKGFGLCNIVSSSMTSSTRTSTSSTRVSSTSSQRQSSSIATSSSTASQSLSVSSSQTLASATVPSSSSVSSSISGSSSSIASSSPSLTISSIASSASSILPSSSSSLAPSSSSVLPPTPSCVQQLLANGDFETGQLFPEWGTFSANPSSQSQFFVGADGSRSNVFKLTTSTGTDAHIRQSVNIPAGTSLYFSYTYRTIGDPGAFKAYVEVGSGSKFGMTTQLSATYQTISGTIQTTVDANTFYLWTGFGSNQGGFQFFADDIQLCLLSVGQVSSSVAPSSSAEPITSSSVANPSSSVGSSSSAYPSSSPISSSMAPSSSSVQASPSTPAPSNVQSISSSAPSFSPSPSASAAPGNILSNSGFESGQLSPWIISNFPTVDFSYTGVGTSDPHAGSYSFQARNSVGLPWVLDVDQRVTLTPGSQYMLKFWARYHIYSSCTIYALIDTSIDDDVSTFTFNIGTTYTQYSGTFPATRATSGNLILQISCTSYMINDYVVIDDVTLVAI